MSMQYELISKSGKNDIFRCKSVTFFLFLLKDRLWVLVRTASTRRFYNEAVLTSTHNLCFKVKNKKNEYPCKPQFYYIKVGCKGVFISRTCLHDVKANPIKEMCSLRTIYAVDLVSPVTFIARLNIALYFC